MKYLLLVLVLAQLMVSPALTMQHKGMGKASSIQLDKLKNQKGTWASFMVNLAEIHLGSGGPLDQLLEAIEEVVNDLNRKLQSADEAFQRRTVQHEEDVVRYQNHIDTAGSDIAATTEFLQILAFQKQSLVQDVANLEQNIKTCEQQIDSSNTTRARENAEYEAKVPDHKEAVAAVEEALQVLSELHGGQVASLLQVKKLKKNVSVLNNKMKRGQDKAFLNALMEIASSAKFADQGAIAKVEEMLQAVKQNLQNSLVQFTVEEQQAQAAHEEFVKQKTAEINQLSQELVDTKSNIVLTEERIADNQEFLAQRVQDKKEAEEDLANENEAYERDTKTYEDLVAQFQVELNACQLAQQHLENAEFADYIGNRMEQDVVIGSNHGSGVTVESNPFDLE